MGDLLVVDLIDRNKLLWDIEDKYCVNCDNCNCGESRLCEVKEIINIIDSAVSVRSIDAKPTYWVKETDRTRHWHCPKCGYTVGLADMWDNYCPKCGIRIARKEGEKLDF